MTPAGSPEARAHRQHRACVRPRIKCVCSRDAYTRVGAHTRAQVPIGVPTHAHTYTHDKCVLVRMHFRHAHTCVDERACMHARLHIYAHMREQS